MEINQTAKMEDAISQNTPSKAQFDALGLLQEGQSSCRQLPSDSSSTGEINGGERNSSSTTDNADQQVERSGTSGGANAVPGGQSSGESFGGSRTLEFSNPYGASSR
ncbi:MAG: hypothetical protein KC777_25500 [Cyanobacteria bacterium HKST-UBA02]|nr:hypothetical protein [Cyanobacteria bacterium HKST-UBA02]